MKFLVDYNLDGYAAIFAGVLRKQGWLELVSIDFVTFQEAGLAIAWFGIMPRLIR